MREILALIYIRTLLELAEYRQTPTMLKMFKRCTELEKRLYNKDKKLYNQCQYIAKEVWTKIKDDNKEYVIEVEPVITNAEDCTVPSWVCLRLLRVSSE